MWCISDRGEGGGVGSGGWCQHGGVGFCGRVGAHLNFSGTLNLDIDIAKVFRRLRSSSFKFPLAAGMVY